MTYIRMRLPKVTVIEPPAPLLTTSEVRSWLGISDDDALLSLWIGAACAQIEPPNGWVGRAFGLQTIEQRGPWFADCWGGHELKLRFPPFREMVSVKYLDSAGVEQPFDASDYEVVGKGEIARLILPYGGTWPDVILNSESIRIRYVVGYDHDDPQLNAAKAAVALAVRNLRSVSARDLAISAENIPGVGSRNYIVSETASRVISGAVESLLSGYRVWH